MSAYDSAAAVRQQQLATMIVAMEANPLAGVQGALMHAQGASHEATYRAVMRTADFTQPVMDIGSALAVMPKGGGTSRAPVAQTNELVIDTEALASRAQFRSLANGDVARSNRIVIVNSYSSNPELLKRDLAGRAGIPKYIDLTKPGNVWGLDGQDLLTHYRLRGFDGSMQPPKAKTSGLAQVFDLEGHPDIGTVQFHPGGGRAHGGSYYKFTMHDGSEVKIIDPATYNTRTVKQNSTFFNQQGQRIVFQNGRWVIGN